MHTFSSSFGNAYERPMLKLSCTLWGGKHNNNCKVGLPPRYYCERSHPARRHHHNIIDRLEPLIKSFARTSIHQFEGRLWGLLKQRCFLDACYILLPAASSNGRHRCQFPDAKTASYQLSTVSSCQLQAASTTSVLLAQSVRSADTGSYAASNKCATPESASILYVRVPCLIHRLISNSIPRIIRTKHLGTIQRRNSNTGGKTGGAGMKNEGEETRQGRGGEREKARP